MTAKGFCPERDERFKPSLKELLVSAHAASVRQLRCPKCHEKRFCGEATNEKR
jgi:hypothetical protein